MIVTIIADDKVVIVNGQLQNFDFTDLLDISIHAVQWETTSGHIEYKDGSPNEIIGNFFAYQPIVDRFYENETTIKSASQVDSDVILVEYVSGYGSQTMTTVEATTAGINYIPFTLEEAQATKTLEINNYANILIEDAYANPTQADIDIDPITYRNNMSVRRNNKSDKIAGEISLSQEEKDEAKTDQKLSEYEQKILADKDKAIENMLKLDIVNEITNFNVSAENWNVWTPPI